MDDALRLACAAGGVEHEEHVFTVQGLRGTGGRLLLHCLGGGGGGRREKGRKEREGKEGEKKERESRHVSDGIIEHNFVPFLSFLSPRQLSSLAVRTNIPPFGESLGTRLTYGALLDW